MGKKVFASITAIFTVFFSLGNVFSQFCTDPGSIRRIRNTSIGNHEYVVIDVFTPPNPNYSVSTVSPPFIEDPSGNPVNINGSKFKKIRFEGVVWTCQIREEFTLPRTAIKDIENISQFEGIVEIVVGYRNASRYRSTYYYDVGSIRKVVMKFRK
ncbi:MAG: hypothetical protein WBD22_09500 [Pyrinomonadaceae bacterium]